MSTITVNCNAITSWLDMLHDIRTKQDTAFKQALKNIDDSFKQQEAEEALRAESAKLLGKVYSDDDDVDEDSDVEPEEAATKHVTDITGTIGIAAMLDTELNFRYTAMIAEDLYQLVNGTSQLGEQFKFTSMNGDTVIGEVVCYEKMFSVVGMTNTVKPFASEPVMTYRGGDIHNTLTEDSDMFVTYTKGHTVAIHMITDNLSSNGNRLKEFIAKYIQMEEPVVVSTTKVVPPVKTIVPATTVVQQEEVVTDPVEDTGDIRVGKKK